MDDLPFPDDPWSVDLTPQEWAALLLLREPELLAVRDGESPADFYDPVTRSLAPANDPVFESKVAALRERRTANVNTILSSITGDYEFRRIPEFGEVDIYDPHAGEQEYALEVALARWRRAKIDFHRLIEIKGNRADDSFAASTADFDKELDDAEVEVHLAQRDAQEAWIDFRRRLDIYVNRIRLASLIIKRRNEIGLSQEQFAAATGLSTSTVKNFENVDEPGRWFSPKTLGLMEAGLGWIAGSINRVMSGGEPNEIQGWTSPSVRLAPRERVNVGQGTSGDAGGSEFGSLRVSLDPDTLDVLRKCAVAEDRKITAVLSDAVAFYAKFHLEEES